MLAETVRSGLVESIHPGTVVAVDAAGAVVGRWGAGDRPFFMRSAAKPFQATVSCEAGAELTPEELAVACASHSAEPVHLALVEHILAAAGLDRGALRCPPDHPYGESARRRQAARGERHRRPLFHNCSGKHAAMLAACAVAGWPQDDYRDPNHPLQRRVANVIAEVTAGEVAPVGVDGCGLPTFRTTTTGLARAYSKLAGDERFRPAFSAMRRFPLLTSGSGRIEGMLAIASGGAAKGGAEGCVGLGLDGGLGVAAKAFDGNLAAAVVGLTQALDDLGLVPNTAGHGFGDVARVAVLGGGRPVGALQPVARRIDADT